MSESMRMFRRGEIYYVEFRRGKWRSLKTSDEKQAKAIFREIQKEHLRGRLIQLENLKRKKISEFAEFYETGRAGVSKWTLKKDLLALKLLREAIGDIDLRTITPAQIDKFKSVCLSRKATAVTINGYLRHIKAALAYALDNNIIKSKPKIKMLPVYRVSMSERIISPENIKKIIESALEHIPALGRYFTVLIWTGGRRREVLDLQWKNVDLDRGTILLTKTKGKQDRRIPLLPGAKAALEPIRRDVGRVFPEWHPDTVSKWFHEAAMLCGVKARLHDLRHSAATYLLKSGVPVHVVKEILGHAHISTTMIYSHVLDDVLAKEMAKMRIE